MHGRLDLPDLAPLFAAFPEMALVSISDHQRRPLPQLRWLRTVHHGLPLDLYPFTAVPGGDYLAFVGRICPEKRPDRAVEIARRAGLPLKIAAKVDAVDEAYFAEVVRPLLCDPLVEFIGEIGEAEKASLLGNARALLFPVDWPEQFGLVMIESMACGTPVIAWRCGSVPEVVEHGVTGYVVDGIEAAVAAVDRVGTLDRALIRQRFEQRFGAQRMAEDYLAVYKGVQQVIELPVLGRMATTIQRPDATTPAAAGNALPMSSRPTAS